MSRSSKRILVLSAAVSAFFSCAGGPETRYGSPVFGTVTEPEPIVRTEYGAVSGENRDGVAIFRGIPYGAPVSGEARFSAAARPQAWEGVRDCTSNGTIAMQYRFSGSISNGESGLALFFNGGRPELFGCSGEKHGEDCLVLNVVTPGLDRGKRPVIVYLHGGGYNSGTGSLVLGSDGLAREEDVVIVGVNHRLNVFGFLYLGHLDPAYETSGSVGIQDLVLALEWVRDNIAAFGGDPGNVTILGESGGAMKVNNLLAMPSARGLFHKAVPESGSTRVCAYSKQEAAANTDALLSRLGLDRDSWREIFGLDAWRIFDASVDLNFEPVADGNLIPYVEGGTWAPGCGRDIPLLCGSSADELGVFLPIASLAEETTWENLPQRASEAIGLDSRAASEAVAVFRKANPEDAEPWHVLVNMMSMANVLGGGAYFQAAARSAAGMAPVFHYFIEYDSESPASPELRCAWHTADLPLQFRIVYKQETEELSRKMAHCWAAFARTGNPSTDSLEWPAFSPESPSVMVFGDSVRIEADPARTLREALGCGERLSFD
ncbi:MAG: carboxylesterase/lipase family protein [Candidatus Cryptobacteroides sp.]